MSEAVRPTDVVVPLSGRLSALPRAWRVAGGVWLASRLVALGFAAVVGQVWPAHRRSHVPGWLWSFSVYDRWDSGWFLHLARLGYFARGPRDPSVAFFPGYPLAGRMLAVLIGGPDPQTWAYLVALTTIAWAASLVAAVQLWHLVAEEVNERAAGVAVVLLLAGPFADVLVSSYSEALYLALALPAWRCARRERYGWAGLLAGAAALVRINGMFLALALMVMAAGVAVRRRSVPRTSIALLLPFASVLGYFTYLRIHTGVWNAWARAQAAAWNRHFAYPWQAVERTWALFENTRHSPAHHLGWALELMFAGGYVLLALVLAGRRAWPELTLVVLTAGSLFTTTFLESVPRSMVTVLPAFVLIAGWVSTRSRGFVILVGSCSTALLIFDTATFLHGSNGM